jgi:membrane fusion protein, heavy metal efflux system
MRNLSFWRLAAIVLAACGATPAAAQTAAEHEIFLPMEERGLHAAGIETQPVESESGAGELVVQGVVAVPPQQLRMVAAPAAGLVEMLLVAPDEEVAQGDPIARLKSADLVEAQRLYLHADADATLAIEKLRRDEQLYKEKIIAERRLLVTRAETLQARSFLQERAEQLALVGMTEAEIATLKKDRRFFSALVVRAPIAGTVLTRHGAAGERVQASAPLVTIAQLDPIWVNLQIPVSRAVALEQTERVILPSLGRQGRLIRIGRTVDASTQSITAVVEVTLGDVVARPGQALQAIITLRGGKEALWRTPADAVVHHRGRNFVFVRGPSGFRAVPVAVLSETPQYATLKGAFAANDRVATRGIVTLLAELAAADQ